jgi:hypothetical protein
MERIFDPMALLVLGIAGAVAFIAGLILGGFRDRPLSRGLQGAILAVLAGFLGRTFVSLLMLSADDSPEAGLLIGWAFFLWPGAIDTVLTIVDEPVLTTPENLMWIATGVGALTGMFDGIYRIYDWSGVGAPAFFMDKTWGLAGSTNSGLLHLVNLVWGGHTEEPGKNAHRYTSGFRVKNDSSGDPFAFTQGNVMSALPDGPSTGLYKHEQTHVLQNRLFGPFFMLSYLSWMVVMFIPGLIAGAVKAGVAAGIERFCYFNNPWEAWGYKVQNVSRASVADGGGPGALIWSNAVVVVSAVIYFAIAVALAGLAVTAVW